ncbi:jg18465 [Pararge aegeria aegeria]|uniref:Jg18465 protein n=1 Tax=Pararge aegeria aegeria TaxID=348720 RepID=A0A8S4RLD0_9NEOP|nr:jg18465 [Pararge aegeria aegeria]
MPGLMRAPFMMRPGWPAQPMHMPAFYQQPYMYAMPPPTPPSAAAAAAAAAAAELRTGALWPLSTLDSPRDPGSAAARNPTPNTAAF